MSAAAPVELAERPVQLQGNALAAALLRAGGWQLRFDGLPARQGVLIVYPHTSNWDFPIGLLAKWALGFPLAFWGKDSLFRLPLFGRWMRWVGGVPVDRSGARGIVAETVERFDAARERDEFFWLALSPEGTRGYRDAWRSGFYQVALAADVPLGLATIDYRDKLVGVLAFVRLSGDREADMALIARHLAQRQGRHAALAAPVRLSGASPSPIPEETAP